MNNSGKIWLLILCFQVNWVIGQNISKKNCGDFRMQLAEQFVKGIPNADSITLASIKNEKYLKFYKEQEGFGKLLVQMTTLTSIDSLGLVYEEMVKKQYMDTHFAPFNGKLLNGEKIRSPEAGTITVINTWFTRCKPCIEEMPALNELKMKYEKDTQVKFISIARDQKEAVTAFLKQHEFTYDVMVDESRKILDSYCLSAFPTNIVVDQNGIVRYFEQGIANLDGMVAAIERLKK